MIDMINNTPFQAETTVLMDQHGDNLAVVAVKATFTISCGNNYTDMRYVTVDIVNGQENDHVKTI